MKLKAKFSPRRDGSFGKVMDYQIDAQGVVDVADEHVEFLLGTGNFELAEAAEDECAGGDTEMPIQNGEQTINLMAMDKAELLALANDEMGLKLHHKIGVDKLRAAIMAYVQGE